jgi:1,4-dihydroxy-6-naphthoate synthase
MSAPDVSELAVGFSPCPNDTFMFHEFVFGEVGPGQTRYRPVMEDIESLNLRSVEARAELPITKLSVAALGRCVETYRVLPAGAALGRGVGPLVVRRADDQRIGNLEDLAGLRVAVPGANTTANLLVRSFAPADIEPVVMSFDQIMGAVTLHEGRFTFADAGLAKVVDLGELWEAETQLPLPLGLICVRRELDPALADEAAQRLRASIESARRDAGSAWPWIREHSQEMSESVCREHIDLYVNEFSVDLGDEGRAAVDEMFRRAREAGVFPAGPAPW